MRPVVVRYLYTAKNYSVVKKTGIKLLKREQQFLLDSDDIADPTIHNEI
jgi:hypothetical protein